MRNPLFLLVLCCWSLLSFGQEMTAEILMSQPLEAERFIGVDKFEHIYYLKKNNLYLRTRDMTYEFAALNLGEITTVDYTNPLKITVFYRNANTVVILDNTLSEIKRINFSSLDNFRNVSHATTANDRRLWIFNTDLQQLEIFDYNQNKVVVEFPPRPGIPDGMTSNFNFCWTLVGNRLEKYNVYGAFINATQLDIEVEKAQSFHRKVVLQEGNNLYIRKAPMDDFLPIKNLEIPIQEFSFTQEILYIYDGQNLTTARLKPSQK